MANDLLGGLMKGLSSFMPQDDPNVKIMKAKTEISDLESQKGKLFEEIGKAVYEKGDNPEFQTIFDKIKIIDQDIEKAKQNLQTVESEKTAIDKENADAKAARTCKNCGFENEEGMKFCSECGTKLGITKKVCSQCGAEYSDSTAFCGECGARL